MEWSGYIPTQDINLEEQRQTTKKKSVRTANLHTDLNPGLSKHKTRVLTVQPLCDVVT